MGVKNRVYGAAAAVFRAAGLHVSRNRPVRDPVLLFATKARQIGVKTVFDVGANVGQFAKRLRALGYQNRIVSFEPQTYAHAQLRNAASKDDYWTVAPRGALGDVLQDEVSINVALGHASSSLLLVTQRAIAATNDTKFVGTEHVRIDRLDDVVRGHWENPFAVKLDTQGFELHVLRGAPRTLQETSLLMVELSLSELYEGGASFVDLYRFIEDLGFRCVSLTETFSDHARDEMLAMDGVFVR